MHKSYTNQSIRNMMDDNVVNSKDLVQLARLALAGKKQDVQVYIRRLINRYHVALPELADQLGSLLSEPSNGSSVLRGAIVDAIPVDLDSRLPLARPEYPVQIEREPIWDEHVRENLEQILFERNRAQELYKANLHPTKSTIFTGPPGVGKTLAARWIASKLDRPLIVLDLAAVMSSFLGRTGNNIRNVLDYAKGIDCVLLLDEFDAIAKRRDDAIEVGELKRLVTVLLQEIDDWPASGLLIAATNHKDLLDPAVWRRFELIIEFPMPGEAEVKKAVELYLGADDEAHSWTGVLARAFYGLSYAEVERALLQARRQAVLQGQSALVPLRRIVKERVRSLDRDVRTSLALALMKRGLSQRETHDWTGVSRDTIRKAVNR
jgi:SpoVK/Ycf46/Vps4 family AAA+-type ATPase